MPEAEAVVPAGSAAPGAPAPLAAGDAESGDRADGAPSAPRRVTKFTLRRDATRAALIELGRSRFRIKGYSGTTIDDIVRDSGYTRGAFYFHFTSREEFFLAVLMARSGVRGPWWQTAERPELTTLRDIVIATYRVLASGEDELENGAWVLPVVDFMQAVRDQPEHLAAAQAYHERGLGELSRFVAILQQRDLARTDVDARALAEQLYAMNEGFSVHRELWGMPGTLIADTVVRLLQP